MSREDAQFFCFNFLNSQQWGTKYNLGEALLMATYAGFLLRQGHLQLGQIGFITQPGRRHNYQTNVLRHLLHNQLSECDGSVGTETIPLKDLAIGSEYEFTLQSWTRDAILRGRSNWSLEEERAMCLRWYAITIRVISNK